MRDRFEDLMADILAYAVMAVAAPLVIGPVYVLMNGTKPGWKWLFRLLRTSMDICASPLGCAAHGDRALSR
jgi:hypothetical protein